MRAFILVLTILGLLVSSVLADTPVLGQIAMALIVLLVAAWLWNRQSLSQIGIRRVLSADRARVGETINEDLELINHSPLPKLYVEVEDFSTLAGHSANRVVSIGSKSSAAWSVTSVATKRGTYRLGPFAVRSGDPFGLFQSRRVLPVVNELAVYPVPMDVSSIQLPVMSMSGGSTRPGQLATSSATVAGIRDYVPGDALSRISWTATARRGAMMVKEFDPDPSSDIWIFLDLGEDGQFDLSDPTFDTSGAPETARYLDSTVEYVVGIGASLAERALSDNRKVGMVVNRSMPIRIDPDSSQRQWFRIFEVLATANAYGNRSMTEALRAESMRLSRSTGVVIVSSDPQGDWVPAAASLVDRHVGVTAVIIDAGGDGNDDVEPLIARLAAARVAVHRFPTHTAVHRPHMRIASLRG